MVTRKLNILHVINSLEIGGAETFLLRLIKEQVDVGHKVFLLVVTPAENDKRFEVEWLKVLGDNIFVKWTENKLLKPLGERVNGLTHRVARKKTYDSFKEFQKRKYYLNIFRNNNIDVINSHLLGADFFVVNELINYIDFPFVVTSQGCYNEYDNIANMNALIPHISGMTFVANKNLKIFNKSDAKLTENKKLVYNGVPLPDKSTFKKRSSFGIKDDDFVFGQVTRSIPTKGMEVSIKAIIKIVEMKGLDNVKLLIIGPENEYYKGLANKYSDYEFIIFPGVALNPIDFVGMFDVGMLPSYFPSESCPSTIVEYLSCEVPVISTGVGEIKSMVDYNGEKAGIIIDELDGEEVPDYELFAVAAYEMYTNSQQYQLFKSITSKAFSKFLIILIQDEYLNIYQKSIEQYSN
jgi:glycosyltransferase involved in cell wall biosynthesis